MSAIAMVFAIGCGADRDPASDAGPSDARISADASVPPAADAPASIEGGDRDDGAPRPLVVLPAQFVEENVPLRMLGEGDRLDLWAAPQGGYVVLVAAKVKYLEGDTAILRVRARYPDTPFIVAEEARSVKLVPVPGEPDTQQPELATRTQVAHVPLCPDYDTIDIVDRPLEITIEMSSNTGEARQSGRVVLQLYPTCLEGSPDQAYCRCLCSANYVLGKCNPDAGNRG